MEEKPNTNINDEDIEILDFDDDFTSNETSPLSVKEEPEIIDIDDVEILDINEPTVEDVKQELEINEPIDIIDNSNTIEPIVPNIEEPSNIINIEPIKEQNEIDLQKPIIDIKENIEEPKVKQEEKEITPIENNNQNNQLFVNEELLKNEEIKIPKEEKIIEPVKEKEGPPKKEKGGKLKTVFVGILIFAILISVIIALPFINDYVIKKQGGVNNQSNTSNNNKSEKFKSNINIKNELMSIRDYTNYQYQNLNDIYTKDNKDNSLVIKNNYTYLFNETKFSVQLNTVVSDFAYDSKDYYEKLDDVYNLYINDITTNKITKKITTKEEFEKLTNIYPKTIEYLAYNYKSNFEKEIKVGNDTHIDITLKVSKEILNFLSVETDRIKNKIDIGKLSDDEITVDLFFDQSKRLYKIDFVVEDKNAYSEELEGEVESAVLKYSFTDLNKVSDIELPEL